MIYENYNLPCPLLRVAGSTEGGAFIRSNFEYAPRQRLTYRGKTQFNYGVVLEHYELLSFKQFWADINFGADSFTADFMVHGSDNKGKTLRFIAPYSLKELGMFKYELTAPVEVLYEGTPYADSCPIYPSPILYPSATLYPC